VVYFQKIIRRQKELKVGHSYGSVLGYVSELPQFDSCVTESHLWLKQLQCYSKSQIF